MEFEESAYFSAQQNHQDRILAIDGVTGIGLGLKRSDGELTDQHAIIVFVEDQATLNRFIADGVIPDTLDGIPTDLVVGGHPKPATPDPLQDKQRPLFGGLQIQAGGLNGTLGFLANTNGGATVAVTNEHVIGAVDTVVGQASTGNRIGVTGLSKLNQAVDAAYVSLDPGVTTSGQIGKRDANGDQQLVSVAGTFTPGLGNLPYPVWKTGRSTATTYGNVTIINTAVNHPGGGGIQMTGQLIVDGGTAPMAASGDSGSAIVDDSNDITALLWGIIPNTNNAVASPIAAVEADLNLAGPVVPENADSQEMPVTDFEPVIAGVLHRFEANPRCAPVAAFVRIHGAEIDRLLSSNDHLAVAWHKNSGHDILLTVMNNVQDGTTPLPSKIFNGQDVVEAMDAFGAAMKDHGPGDIAEDAYGIRNALVWMVGKSYAEVFGNAEPA